MTELDPKIKAGRSEAEGPEGTADAETGKAAELADGLGVSWTSGADIELSGSSVAEADGT